MEFEIDDIFETKNGYLWRVSAVVHDDEALYAYDVDGIEIIFTFSDVINQWKKK